MANALKFAIIGVIIVSALSAISDGTAMSAQLAPSLDSNWYNAMLWLKNNTPQDAIVATWWDPGHWITGIAERGAFADGAHCPITACKPYPLNTRIVDMGKVLTTNDEEQAISILKKYMNFTPEQCAISRKTFGDIVPCNSPSEMYFIASSDLIGKYPWPSYFGSLWPKYTGTGVQSQFFQISLQPLQDSNGQTIGYYDQCLKEESGQCSMFNFLVVEQNQQLVGIYQNRYIIKQMLYYINGQKEEFSYENSTLDGMMWIDQSFSYALLMLPDVRDSMFTRMYFFNGEGLSHFTKVFDNAEVKIFKVNFD